MDVLLFIEVGGDAQPVRLAADEAEGRMGGLLHHVPQVAGELHLAGAGDHVDLHLQQLAAHRGPGQAVDHAHALLQHLALRVVPGGAQEVLQILVGDLHLLHVPVGHQAHGRLPADAGDPALQHADARLPGVRDDHGPDGPVGHPQLALLQAVALHLLGQQVALGNLKLLLVGVAGQLDDLHPVQQGPGDGVGGVGGGDEQHVGQVEGHLQEVVPEGAVLLHVQHLQQGGGRVAPVVPPQLVDLVQQDQGVAAPRLVDGGDDPAGHGAHIGLPVAPDLRLVADAAQGNAGELPVHGPGHRHGHRGLAHAGRADKADYLPL